MKSVIFTLILAASTGCCGIAAADEAEFMTPIHQFINDFNKGDLKGAAAAHMDSVSITDDLPPHLWRGPGAFQAWTKVLRAAVKKNAMTDEAVTLGDPTYSVVSGRRAYVVTPITFTFRQKGAAMKVTAQMTYVVQKVAAGWKIAAWTWVAGSPPAPAQ